ncbi:MAG: hypothetical protein Ta2A_14520 [Treponemataceae bacterium]|nr:MAG: hypothetical protein Ta2A_14520 [Treponemataceae bacterium]
MMNKTESSSRKNAASAVRKAAFFAAAAASCVLFSCGASGGGKTLVSAISDLNGKFSPFTGENAYDMKVTELVIGDSILNYDRLANIIYNGIEGETHAYNGTDYVYDGLANCEVVYDEKSGTTTYTYTLRPGVLYSDGHEMDIDDYIFSLYVVCDPSYSGSHTASSVGILGINEYRTKASAPVYERYKKIADAALKAGPASRSANPDTERFFAVYAKTWKDYAQKIVDYCLNNQLVDAEAFPDAQTNGRIKVAAGMAAWGFGKKDSAGNFTANTLQKSWDLQTTFPTIEDFYDELVAAYGTLEAFSAVELIDSSADNPVQDAVNAYITSAAAADPEMQGVSINSIAGIQKLGKYDCSVTIKGFNAAAIYRLDLQPAPLHYYGSEALYDYEAHSFGFPFGDLSGVYAKDSFPLGAGPYKFVKFENKVVYFEANERYWRGAPKTKKFQYKITGDADMITGIKTGAIDISNPSISKAKLSEIAGYNSNSEPSGNVITYRAVDNPGYGYVGLNAKNICVAGERSSQASRALRKGIATVLAAYRDLTVDSFYGETASVINYPMSLTSWAAPLKTDPGYRVAYSVDVDGNDIYSGTMTAEERYEAANQAALGFFQAAGYKFNAKKTRVIAAPTGAKLTYDVLIAEADSHPSFLMLLTAKEALEKIGITLNVREVDFSVLMSTVKSNNAELFVMAWGSSLDPDIHQLYHSSNAIGMGGINSNQYMITDSALDEYIEETRRSMDNAYRKEVFRAAFDIILDWAVEVPVYQRQNCSIFSTKRINTATLAADMTPYWEWEKEVYKIEMQGIF